MKTLLAGPDCSLEMGWLVAVWVPLVRAYSRSFESTIVICRPGHEFLYEDFATSFECDNRKGKQDRWLLNGKKVNPSAALRAKYSEATTCRPRRRKMYEWTREYWRYGNKDRAYHYDVVIHARAITRYDGVQRNWPLENYERLVSELKVQSVCSIGTIAGALHVPGTEDKRGVALRKLCNILASSTVCVGTSSGPMHLASFCGCPHVVFSDGAHKKSISGTNKKRYKKLWNPFHTKCKVLDAHSWQPPVGLAVRATRKFLRD